MQQTQIITFGIEGILAERLREFGQTHRFWLRETSQFAACRNLLALSQPSAVIIGLGRDLERELELLEEVHRCLPDSAAIVVGEANNPALEGLAWELGATYALFPPTPIEAIFDNLSKILQAPES